MDESKKAEMLTFVSAMQREEIITDDFPVEVRLENVKVEPEELPEEEEEEDETPLERTAAPVPLKLLEVSTGKEVHYQEEAVPVPLKLVELSTGIEVHYEPNFSVPDVSQERDPLQMELTSIKEEPPDDDFEAVTELMSPEIKSESVDIIDSDAEQSEADTAGRRKIWNTCERTPPTCGESSDAIPDSEEADGRRIKSEFPLLKSRRLKAKRTRSTRNQKTPEEREAAKRYYLLQKKIKNAILRKNETQEEKMKRLEMYKAAQRKYLANETPERRERRLNHLKMLRNRRMAIKMQQQRELRKADSMNVNTAGRRKNWKTCGRTPPTCGETSDAIPDSEEADGRRIKSEFPTLESGRLKAKRTRSTKNQKTPEEREDAKQFYLLQKKMKNALLRENETEEEKTKRLEMYKAAQRKYLANETPERRAKRLNHLRMLHYRRMANETQEQRELRLRKVREYYARNPKRNKKVIALQMESIDAVDQGEQ